MGLVDDKRNVINNIAALDSLGSINDGILSSNLSSINTEKNVPNFLIDVLTVIVGSEPLKGLLGDFINGVAEDLEPTIKTSLKKQLTQFDSEEQLPSDFETNGYVIPVSDIDLNDILREDPASSVGELIYSDVSDGFLRKMKESITSESEIIYKNITITYSEASDTLTFKPLTSGQSKFQFINDFIDDIDIIDGSLIAILIVDLIFGTIQSNRKKSKEKLLIEEKNRRLKRKFLSDQVIMITQDELNEINGIVEDKFNGVYSYDIGCGVLESELSIEDLNTLKNNISGVTDNINIINEYADILNKSLSNHNFEDDRKTIEDNFFKGLIERFIEAIIDSITATPQARIIYILSESIKQGEVVINSLGDQLNNNINQYKCIKNDVTSEINEFIFDLVKGEIEKLVIPLSKKILTEKINQNQSIIKSLVRI